MCKASRPTIPAKIKAIVWPQTPARRRSVEMRAEADRLVAIASRRDVGPSAPLCDERRNNSDDGSCTGCMKRLQRASAARSSKNVAHKRSILWQDRPDDDACAIPQVHDVNKLRRITPNQIARYPRRPRAIIVLRDWILPNSNSERAGVIKEHLRQRWE